MRLYEGHSHAAIYARSRPNPPESVIRHFLSYIPAENRRLCVDVGCGSGQSTFPLSTHFETTLGVDVSDSQINQALEKTNNRDNNVKFMVGDETLVNIKDQVIN